MQRVQQSLQGRQNADRQTSIQSLFDSRVAYLINESPFCNAMGITGRLKIKIINAAH